MTHLKALLAVGGAALAIAALPASAQAECRNGGCPNHYISSGGTDVPAPAAFALFGLGAGILAARRRRTRA